MTSVTDLRDVIEVDIGVDNGDRSHGHSCRCWVQSVRLSSSARHRSFVRATDSRIEIRSSRRR